jgi:uncharacterized membrane protein
MSDGPHADVPAGALDDAAAMEPSGSTADGPDQPAGATYDAELDPGTTLWAFRFDHPLSAQEALLAAMRLQARGHLRMDDAAIAHRTEGGKVRIVQTKDISTAQGALSGTWWGLLAGLFVGGPLVGAALGAAVGGIFAKMHDIGINDDQMKAMGEQLDEGHSALFILVTDCHRAHVLYEVGRFQATILYSTDDPDVVALVEERLLTDPWGQG